MLTIPLLGTAQKVASVPTGARILPPLKIHQKDAINFTSSADILQVHFPTFDSSAFKNNPTLFFKKYTGVKQAVNSSEAYSLVVDSTSISINSISRDFDGYPPLNKNYNDIPKIEADSKSNSLISGKN